MFTWLKKLALGTAIRELDQLEPIFALKIVEAQMKFGAIPADQFSKVLVDEAQTKLCQLVGLDPKDVLKEP